MSSARLRAVCNHAVGVDGIKRASKLKSKSEEVYATKQLAEFFENVLLDKNDVYFKKLHDDPRFFSLVDRIKEELKQE